MEPEQTNLNNSPVGAVRRSPSATIAGGQDRAVGGEINNPTSRFGQLRQGAGLVKKMAGKTGKGGGGESGDGEKSKPNRINFLTAGGLIVVAIIFDLLSIIPIVNVIAMLFAWITFPLWFILLGVGFMNPRRVAAPIISVIVELIPAISIIPSITLAVIITIIMVKSEDNLGLKLPTPSKLAKV